MAQINVGTGTAILAVAAAFLGGYLFKTILS